MPEDLSEGIMIDKVECKGLFVIFIEHHIIYAFPMSKWIFSDNMYLYFLDITVIIHCTLFLTAVWRLYEWFKSMVIIR